jgi:hypothetical protein
LLANYCLLWINRAFSYGVIQEGQGLAEKLDECREEKNQFKKELSVLSMKYLALQKQHEEFKKHVGLKSKAD